VNAPDIQFPRVVTWMAALVTAVVALVLPMAVFGLGYGSLASEITTKAQIKAEIVNQQLISTAPDLWRYQEHRLHELFGRLQSTAREIRDALLELE